MSNPLTAVRRAASRRKQADSDYRAAIRAAREAGHTMPEIGEAAGIGKQTVFALLYPERRKEQKT